VTPTAAVLLMQRLGLTEDELCRALGIDPLSVIAGELDHKPQVPVLLALTEEAAERGGEDVLRRWLRVTGPAGRPLDHLLARDYLGFENDLGTLAERGFVLRAGGGSSGAGPRGEGRGGDWSGAIETATSGEATTPGRVPIRRIAASEAQALREIRLRALADAPLAFGSTHGRESAYAPETWAAWARDAAGGAGEAIFFAIGENGAPVGLASGVIAPAERGLAHLYAMWVAPEGRGAGAGAGLVEAVAGWAAQNGATRLRTSVTLGNDPAARLYERTGFRDTGLREPLGHSNAEVAVLERLLADPPTP
jgi:ribosomal protein S18 acetylase RimI-like enzyme